MSATIRHLGVAVDLAIQGALAQANFGPEMSEDEYRLECFREVARQLGGWMASETPSDRLDVAQEIDGDLIAADPSFAAEIAQG